jgi:hypothetical protein
MTTPTQNTDTARRLAEAESNLQTAVTALERMEADTKTLPDALAAELSAARECLNICEKRANTARADHKAALAVLLQNRITEIQSAANALDEQALTLCKGYAARLIADGFTPGAVESLLLRESPAAAVELRRQAAACRDRVEAAQMNAKSNPAFALSELNKATR